MFDYLADLFKFDNSRGGRAKSWGVTFLPPLVLSLLFPFGFLVAIGYAGAVATLWTCIIPPLLAWKVRKAAPDDSAGFRAPGGILMIGLVILFGVLTAAFHLLNMAGLLPAYTG
ncbi:Tryptophan-specific transport protein [compost metagenome]